MRNRIDRKITRFWRILGPGFTTGAADDDPSGIATYSQAGAVGGFSFLWLSILSFPLMGIVQEMCARIGLATGRGLASNIRKHLPSSILYTVTIFLVIANVINIGADLGAMAEATRLVWDGASFEVLVVLFAIISVLLQILMPYEKYAKYLKWMALVLLAYVFAALFIPNISVSDLVAGTFLPTFVFDKQSLFIICGILGTTISPYLFFWQTSQEIEEEIALGKKSISARVKFASPVRISDMRKDVWFGMLFSNLIMYFIILTTGAVLHGNGITTITSAAQAAYALSPFLGTYAYLAFAFGIVGTGLLAVPVLAGSATYAVTETLGIRGSLSKKWHQAVSFYTVLVLSMLAGMLLNFIGIDAIQALLYSAVANGLVAPLMLACIVYIASREKIMGKYVNSQVASLLGWVTVAIMFVVALFTVVSFFQ